MMTAAAKRPASAGIGTLPRALTRAFVGAAMMMAVLAGTRSEARAQDASAAVCSFIEIKATNDEGGIDSKLTGLSAKLKKPPFSSWKTFSLLAKHSKDLERMKAQDIPLKLGGKLSALFRQHSKSKGKKDRVSLSMTLDDKEGKRALDTTVHVDTGDYVVIGYSMPEGSGHLLAVSCTVK